MIDFLKGTVTPKDWAFLGIMAAVAVAIGGAFYMLVYTKQAAQLADLQSKLQDEQSSLKQARDMEKNFDKLQSQSEKMDKLVKNFDERLPDEREVSLLVELFESLAEQAGLRVQLTVLTPMSDKEKETLPYKVTSWGDFHQIVTFMNLLERNNRYLKISDIEIDEEEAGISEATFTLSTFRFLTPPEEPPADKDAKEGAAKTADKKAKGGAAK